MSEATPVEDLTPDEAAAELARLAALISEADAAYYQEDAPVLTDAEYDAARQRTHLEAAQRSHPELMRGVAAQKLHVVTTWMADIIRTPAMVPRS